MSTTKKKRIGSRRLLNQNLHETHETVDTANSMAAQELPEETKAEPLLSLNSAPSEGREVTGSRRKLGSTRAKGKEHFTDFTTESHHKPREEVAENTEYLPAVQRMNSLRESLQTADQPRGLKDQSLARENEMVINEGPQLTTDESLNALTSTKTQAIATRSGGSAIGDPYFDAKSGRHLNDYQSEPEIGRAQQGVLQEREAKQMPGIPEVTFPPADVTGERTCSVKLMESEENIGVHKFRAGPDDANTKHDTEGLYQKREDKEFKHTTEKSVDLQSKDGPLPTVNIRKMGSSQRRKERKQVYDELEQQWDKILLETELTVQPNTSQKEVSVKTQNNEDISAKGVKYKEDQVECHSSPKEEVGLDHMNKGYDLPTDVSEAPHLEVTTPDNEAICSTEKKDVGKVTHLLQLSPTEETPQKELCSVDFVPEGQTEVIKQEDHVNPEETERATDRENSFSGKHSDMINKEEDQEECYSSPKEEIGLDHINKYNLPEADEAKQSEEDETVSQETQVKDFSSKNENKDKCPLIPTEQRDTAQDEDQQVEIKQSDEQPVLLQKEEPSGVGEILSSLEIPHTDINAALTSKHQDISVSGKNITDAGSPLLKHKRKLGSSRKIKGRKQSDERSEENITPNEAIETTLTEPVTKEESLETAVDNYTFETADRSSTTEASYQQLDKAISDAQYNRRSEEDTTFRPVSHITEEVSTEERGFTEQSTEQPVCQKTDDNLQHKVIKQDDHVKPPAGVKYKDNQHEMHSSLKVEKDFHQINEDAEWIAAIENSSHRKHTETVLTDKDETANVSNYRLFPLTAEDSAVQAEATFQIPEMDSRLNNDNLKEEIHTNKTTQHRRKLGSSRREKGRQKKEDSEGKFSNQFECFDDEPLTQENQKEDTVMEIQGFTIKGQKEDHTGADDLPCDTASGTGNAKSQEMTTGSHTSHEDSVRTDRFNASQTDVMPDAGDNSKKQRGSEDIDVLDSGEKQKRRKMGSTRSTQLNRKQQEVVKERNLKTDNVVADEVLVTFTQNENSKPLPSVIEQQEASVVASSISDQQNNGVSELHRKETKERSETAHEDKTGEGAMLEMVTGATAHDTHGQSVCPSTGSQIKHSSPDLSLTDKKRKMGSTRKNLRISKGEKEENETTAVNVLSEVALSSSGEKVEQQDVETKGEDNFESVDQSSHFSGSHSVHQRPDDENHPGQLNNAEHLTPECISEDPDDSSITGLMTEAEVVVRKRKMGSHRKPHGDKSNGPGEAPTNESLMQTLEKHKDESSTLEQTPEANENDNKALSSSSTPGMKVESKPVSDRQTEQIQPSSKVHLAQESKIQLSSGYGQGGSLGASKYEVVMIGDSSVGKTSFMKRAQSGKFSLDLPASVGLDSYTWTVVVDGKRMVLHLWDTAGQERFHSMTKQIFHRARGFLLMYDVTCAQSFSAVSYWANSIKERAAEDAVILLLGNKSDCTERQVKREEGEILAQGYNFAFMECSAATGENIIEALETIARLLSQKATREEAVVLHKKPQRNKFGCC